MDAPAREPNVRQAVPFFGVRSMEASLRFYVDGLGFRMTNKWIDEGRLRWCYGLWTTSVVDPDGYHLYFASPADAPEETVLDE